MEKIKKIDLHLHLDGSINKEYAEKLLNKKLTDELTIKGKCKNLKEYLDKFNLPISLLQTKENLEDFSYLLTKDLVNDNVIYAEIRFCPLFHTQKGLSEEEVIQSVLNGLKKNRQIKTNLILCMMRNLDYNQNVKIIELAYRFLKNGVVALDLAGDEEKYNNDKFVELFKLANKLNIPLTIHSGEVSVHNSILLAIKYGAKRIGHGINAIKDLKIIEEIKKNNITLEICPTSNVQTNAISKYENHPIKKLYECGVKITINTDNRTVSNITLSEEYNKLINDFNFTIQDFKLININAINSSFLDDNEKKQLLEIMNEK